MTKYQIYRPGEGWLVGEFCDRGGGGGCRPGIRQEGFQEPEGL